MNPKDAQIPGVYLYTISECMNDFNISQEVWLKDSPFKTITGAMIDETVSYKVMEELGLKAISLSKNKTLGIQVGHRLSLQSHGILGYALMNSNNLEAAAKLLEQYISLRFPLVQVSNQYKDGDFTIEIIEKFPLNELRNTILEGIVVAIKSALDQLMPKLKKNITLHFPSAGNDEISYESLKDCRLVFNSPTAKISIAQELMSSPIPLANLAAYKEAEILCAKELQSLKQQSTYKSKVKQKILENSENFPTQAVMASWFNMTSRTLHRRLTEENSSYREILGEVKNTLALSYLENTHLSIQEIAYFLGYEDDRNFNRAFKRWEGVSPSNYRKSKMSDK